MRLNITPPKGLAVLDFINNYLLEIIPEVFIDNVDLLRLSRFDEYINSLEISPKALTGKKRYMSVKDALHIALYNLVVEYKNGSYSLTINPDLLVPNFNIKMITVAGIVNYGTISVSPYPIIDETLDIVANNMGQYYFEYLMGDDA